MLNRYCQGFKVDQSIPLQDDVKDDKGNTFRKDCMVALAINADFLFLLQNQVTGETLTKLNKYSSVCNQIKAIASFQTTWVSLYMMVLDSILEGRGDDFVSVSSTYEPHQFLVNGYLTNDQRPKVKTWEKDLNILIEGWYTKIYEVYLNSELISPKLNEFLRAGNMEQIIRDEVALCKSSPKGQSVDSKLWYQAVSERKCHCCLVSSFVVLIYNPSYICRR